MPSQVLVFLLDDGVGDVVGEFALEEIVQFGAFHLVVVRLGKHQRHVVLSSVISELLHKILE